MVVVVVVVVVVVLVVGDSSGVSVSLLHAAVKPITVVMAPPHNTAAMRWPGRFTAMVGAFLVLHVVDLDNASELLAVSVVSRVRDS